MKVLAETFIKVSEYRENFSEIPLMALITISNRYYQLTILTVWDHETMRRVLLTGQQVGLVL